MIYIQQVSIWWTKASRAMPQAQVRTRVAYNGRFSGYNIEWPYKLTVITLAVGIMPGANLFTVALDHNVEALAELF